MRHNPSANKRPRWSWNRPSGHISESVPTSIKELVSAWATKTFGKAGAIVFGGLLIVVPLAWQYGPKWATIRSVVADGSPWSERILYGALPKPVDRNQNRFTVEIAYFDGDNADEISNYVAEDMRMNGLAQVMRFPRRIRERADTDESFKQARVAALEELSRSHADVLIWGHVRSVSGTKILRFWPDSDGRDDMRLDTRTHPFKIGLSPQESRDSLVPTVVALALASRLGRVSFDRGAMFDRALQDKVLHAEEILNESQGKFRKEDQPELLRVVGEALQTVGGASDDIEAVRRSERYLTQSSDESCDVSKLKSCPAVDLARRWSSLLGAAEAQITASRHVVKDAQADKLLEHSQDRIQGILTETSSDPLSAVARQEDPTLRVRAQLALETVYLYRAQHSGAGRISFLDSARLAAVDVQKETALLPDRAIDPYTRTMIKLNEAVVRYYALVSQFDPPEGEIAALESAFRDAESSVVRTQRPMLWVVARLARIRAALAHTEDATTTVQRLQGLLQDVQEALSLLPAERYPLKRAQTFQLLGLIEQRLGLNIGGRRSVEELRKHSQQAVEHFGEAIRLRKNVRAPGVTMGNDDIEALTGQAAALTSLGDFLKAMECLNDAKVKRDSVKGSEGTRLRIDAQISCRLGQAAIASEVEAIEKPVDVLQRCLALREFLECWSIGYSTLKDDVIARAATSGIVWICESQYQSDGIRRCVGRQSRPNDGICTCLNLERCALSQSENMILEEFSRMRRNQLLRLESQLH